MSRRLCGVDIAPRVRSPRATTVGNDLDRADPQSDAGNERGENEPFMNGEIRRSAIALFGVAYIGIHRGYSRFVRHFRER
jgi:hypothetical protein